MIFHVVELKEFVKNYRWFIPTNRFVFLERISSCILEKVNLQDYLILAIKQLEYLSRYRNNFYIKLIIRNDCKLRFLNPI